MRLPFHKSPEVRRESSGFDHCPGVDHKFKAVLDGLLSLVPAFNCSSLSAPVEVSRPFVQHVKRDIIPSRLLVDEVETVDLSPEVAGDELSDFGDGGVRFVQRDRSVSQEVDPILSRTSYLVSDPGVDPMRSLMDPGDGVSVSVRVSCWEMRFDVWDKSREARGWRADWFEGDSQLGDVDKLNHIGLHSGERWHSGLFSEMSPECP